MEGIKAQRPLVSTANAVKTQSTESRTTFMWNASGKRFTQCYRRCQPPQQKELLNCFIRPELCDLYMNFKIYQDVGLRILYIMNDR